MSLSHCMTAIDSQGYELVSHGTALFPVACYLDDLASDPVPWHWHDEMEFLLVSQGQAVIHAGSKTHTVSAGDALFINSGILHAVTAAKTSECLIHSAVFHPRLIGGTMDSVFWQKYLNPLLLDNTLECILLTQTSSASGSDGSGCLPWQAEAIRSFDTAWRSCADELPGYEFQVRSDLSRLIFLLSSHRPSAHLQSSEKKVRDGERIKIMMQYIQNHYISDISIAEVARSASLSVSECLRCFKNTIGTTPIQYVRQYRIQKAAELLSATSLKISDIAMQCGFQEMSYFARTFKDIRGCTPSEFRKMQSAPV